jgi:PTS system fructose-specific IIC component
MLLGEILHRSVIQPNLAAHSPAAAIDELIALLVRSGDLAPHQRDPVRKAVLAREESGTSAMGDGVALPHGTTDRIKNIVGAMGMSRAGIDFHAHDGQLANIVVLLVIPRNEFHTYVRNLAGISHLLEDKSFREKLLNEHDPDEALSLIRREEHGPAFVGLMKRLGFRD